MFRKDVIRIKRIYRGILLFFLLLVGFTHTTMAAPVRVTLNDKPLSFDAAPLVENGRVLVPMRGIMEALGYSIHWQSHTQTVIALKEDVTIYLPLNSKQASVNGKVVSIDAPAKLNGSRTFVPLRFLAEYSGAEVLWDPNTSTVSIKADVTVTQSMKDSVVCIQTNFMLGSGVILSEDGLIATNYHVIEKASTAQFRFNDGSIYQGETTIVGLSPENDIALLKIEKSGLSPAPTSTEFNIGDDVTAIGSPYRQFNKASTGVIKAFDRDMISNTAAIAQGSSGGGLFNAKEELIGITTSYGSGQFLALPISRVLEVPQDLSIPLGEMKNYIYTPTAPKNLRYTVNDEGSAYVSWTPVYGADYYFVYISYYSSGPYKKLHNEALKTDAWNWGFPQCFGISINKDHSFHLKVSAVIDGKETEKSETLRVYTG